MTAHITIPQNSNSQPAKQMLRLPTQPRGIDTISVLERVCHGAVFDEFALRCVLLNVVTHRTMPFITIRLEALRRELIQVYTEAKDVDSTDHDCASSLYPQDFHCVLWHRRS